LRAQILEIGIGHQIAIGFGGCGASGCCGGFGKTGAEMTTVELGVTARGVGGGGTAGAAGGIGAIGVLCITTAGITV